MVVPAVLELSSSTLPRMQKLLLVSPLSLSSLYLTADTLLSAKFTGYQYGGRALGLSYVRYTNVSSNGASGEAMDADQTGGLTQDQIM